MSDHDPYGDPRLVALYDEDNPSGPDHAFFRALADRLDARTIIDLGCGTGMLTVGLARSGRTVIGIDPSPDMLDHARHRPAAQTVCWIEGDSGALGTPGADLVIMAGNVAQHVLDPEWSTTLQRIRNALAPGGVLAFESRDPAARVWETWTKKHTFGTRPTDDGPLTEWMHLTRIENDEVTFCAHNVFERTGEQVIKTVTLAFRTQERLRGDLAEAGFTEVSVAGGWNGEPVDAGSGVFVVTARRT